MTDQPDHRAQNWTIVQDQVRAIAEYLRQYGFGKKETKRDDPKDAPEVDRN